MYKYRQLMQNCIIPHSTNSRFLSNTEVSTALRPFYFSVHPDLFGQFPNHRVTNENSLKHLSAFLETLQSKNRASPCTLQFYLRDKENKDSNFQQVKINLKHGELRDVISNILQTCHLSTEYIDKIPKPVEAVKIPPIPSSIKDMHPIRYEKEIDFSKIDENDPIFGPILNDMKRSMQEKRDSFRLLNWLRANYSTALESLERNKVIQEEIGKLQSLIKDQFALTEVKWDCGWNETHLRGCFQSFIALGNQYPDVMGVLKGRILVFAPFTGVSLDGHIMLSSGEVRHNWLDLIRNVKKYDNVLLRIPAFEQAVSHVLRNIKVGRRKFMAKILAGEYERHLNQITTSLNDFQSVRSYPKSWPTSLNDYEIVVETEAGPLMVSPTGQFIVPCTCPGFLLVSFITEHLQEALDRSNAYDKNKHIERSLHEQCIHQLHLYHLRKDDNITPDLMIECCQKLLANKERLGHLNGIHLTIATYYSVLSDGNVCIPWNWNL